MDYYIVWDKQIKLKFCKIITANYIFVAPKKIAKTFTFNFSAGKLSRIS